MGSRGLSALLCFAALAVAASAKEYVLTLTDKNFEEEVKKHDFIVVEFYAPWCGHCKSLAPEYEKAAETLEEEGVPIVLAKVDADAKNNKALASKYGVQGFPTLKVFRKGNLDAPQDYKGPRDAAGIVSSLKKQSGPASSELQSGAEIQEKLGTDQVVVVGVFSDLSSPEFQKFLQAADDLRSDYVFRHTTDASLLPLEHPKLEGDAAVRLLTVFDEGFFDTTDLEVEALKSFIQARSLPSVVEFSQAEKDRPFLTRAFESNTKKILLFYSYNESDADEFKSKFAEAAKSRPEGITFIKGEAGDNEHALKYFGIETAEIPCIVIHDPSSNAKYYRTKIVPDTIKEFLDSFLAGTEEVRLKSEPIPQKNDEVVKVAVGKNFKELVLDSKKNVLIEFYAPWCGHCKKLEPIYKQVGNAFKDDPDVVIAKMDYTANDVPGDQFKVEGFPTIYFYTPSGEIISYSGDRTKKDLINFVKQNKQPVEAAGNDTQVDAAEAAELAAEAKEAAAAEAPKDEL